MPLVACLVFIAARQCNTAKPAELVKNALKATEHLAVVKQMVDASCQEYGDSVQLPTSSIKCVDGKSQVRARMIMNDCTN